VPSNPFAHPLFWPVVLRVAIVLVVGLAAVLLAERRPLRVLRRSTLFIRLRTWLWVAPVFVLVLFTGGFVLFIAALFLTVQTVGEYVRLVGLSRRYGVALLLWSIVGLLIGSLARDFFLFLPFGFFIVLTLIPIASGQVEGAARQVAAALFGYVYVGLPLAFLCLVVTGQPWGHWFALLVGVGVALSDVMAFAAGAALPTPRLPARAAVNKTWSATAGNFAGAAIAFVLLGVIIPEEWSTAGLIVLAIATGLGCVWGDLTGAFLKRDFAVKDAGSLLFGFGGLLERVDSLLFAAPLAYYGLLLVERLSN
jgi:phosphatidate cytidylyltransferase